MKCVVMQPTYLPWAGFFNLISHAQIFVFLDDVQYEKTSWQNRNQVLLNGKPVWITVPARRETLGQKMLTVQTNESDRWRRKHMNLIQQTYAKHPFVKDVLEAVAPIEDATITRLADLNIRLIRSFADRLGLQTRYARSSELNIEADRSERLVKLTRHFGCDEYLSPVGSREYLEKDGSFANSGLKLSFQEFTPGPYPQRKTDSFVSHLSIVDVVANLGWQESLEYVKQGRVNKGGQGDRQSIQIGSAS